MLRNSEQWLLGIGFQVKAITILYQGGLSRRPWWIIGAFSGDSFVSVIRLPLTADEFTNPSESVAFYYKSLQT